MQKFQRVSQKKLLAKERKTNFSEKYFVYSGKKRLTTKLKTFIMTKTIKKIICSTF
jgi:hypothetical protein